MRTTCVLMIAAGCAVPSAGDVTLAEAGSRGTNDAHGQSMADAVVVDAPIDDADLPPTDGGVPVDSACGPKKQGGGKNFLGCSTISGWSCGNDTFTIDCGCYADAGPMCHCLKNSAHVNDVPYVGCPDCTGVGFDTLAKACGFPW